MEYSINKLAGMAGVSTRTLRYYDEIKLLTPKRISRNGYRVYGKIEADRLQQILFYRVLGLPLEDIRNKVDANSQNSITEIGRASCRERV